jgi:hypothetical protein
MATTILLRTSLDGRPTDLLHIIDRDEAIHCIQPPECDSSSALPAQLSAHSSTVNCWHHCINVRFLSKRDCCGSQSRRMTAARPCALHQRACPWSSHNSCTVQCDGTNWHAYGISACCLQLKTIDGICGFDNFRCSFHQSAVN